MSVQVLVTGIEAVIVLTNSEPCCRSGVPNGSPYRRCNPLKGQA